MTRYPRSEPITRAAADRLNDVAATAVGKSLRQVSYRFGLQSGWPAGYAGGEVDEVDQSARLSFSDGTELVISWVTPGVVEGVDVEAGPAGSFPLLEGLQGEAVVSDDSMWSQICGTALEQVSAAWDVTGQLAAETVWAVRLAFAGNVRVVFALGEIDHGTVGYHPTGLLVFFREDWYRAYQNSSISQASPQWQPAGAERH